jgi:hypothetical protein
MTGMRSHLLLAGALALGTHAAGDAHNAPAEIRSGYVVKMPPFLVQADVSTHWIYGEFSGVQVLSSCDGAVTKEFMRRFLQSEAEFAELVPGDFRSDVPELLILVPPSHARTIAAEMSELMRSVSTNAQTMSHLRISGEDSTATYFIVDPTPGEAPARNRPSWLEYIADSSDPDYFRFTLSIEYVLYRLSARQPAMLPCLQSGLADTFESAEETDRGMYSRVDSLLAGADWRAVRFDANAPRPFLPVEDLLGGPPPAAKDAANRRLWRAQSELLVRWALFAEAGKHATGFWRFARGSADHPASEKFFVDCFGLDYADCRDALSDYLPTAVHASAAWAASVPAIGRLWFRTAKPEEIDWCKGEWDRLILSAVKRDFPALLPQYRAQASTVLVRGLARGERSARMLGSLGLLQADGGDAAAARENLEEAVKDGELRPLVRTELARLRLAYFLEAKSSGDRTLTAAEASNVLGLLEPVLKSASRPRSALLVARSVFAHLDRQPTPEEIRQVGGELPPEN